MAGVAQDTGFTYQGHLSEAGTAASGVYDFRFSVWNDASDGSQIGVAITNFGVGVSAGIFTTTLDFGAEVFDGSPRWLEIGVRAGGGGAFTVLDPRQRLNATPYAIRAGSVAGTGISGTIQAHNIGAGTITASMLAPGAAAANLGAAGATVLCGEENALDLIAAGYVQSGTVVIAQNVWRERTTNGAPSPRAEHAAVWTGSKMLVWGGFGDDDPNQMPPAGYLSDGGSYDPVSDRWSAISTNGAPAGRQNFSFVWTGEELMVWGGSHYDGSFHYRGDGARFDAVSNSWRGLASVGAPAARHRHTAVWTGSEMLIWGGAYSDGSGFQNTVLNSGARYDAASDSWKVMSVNGAPVARCLHSAVWTGTEMIVWGGVSGSGLEITLADGGAYNPATDTWTLIGATNVMGGRARHTAVWSGTEMVVWGGGLQAGGRYKAASETWQAMDYSFAPSARNWHSAVWTGREMVVWGGETSTGPGQATNDGGSYSPFSDTWLGMATAPRAPAKRRGHTAVWTGTQMIIFGGMVQGGYWFNDVWACTPPHSLYLYQRP